jgi:NAD(P)-dependent dehydrogenase (short-subunit alcohol dehydrogenase family)
VEINGLVTIIAGGGSGLGAATAIKLASLGAKVAILDQQLDKAQAVADSIGGIAVACDVTQDKPVENAINQVADILGDIRLCVNCAGIAPAKRIVGKQGAMPLQEFTKVIDINLNGTFNVMRVIAEKMSVLTPITEEGERGVIINTSSIAAFEGQLGQVAYSASKGAVASMTLPAARELARFGIRVVAIAPGIFATPMVTGMPAEVQHSLEMNVPFPKRLGKPIEYANTVVFIVENTYINGSVIRIDGGTRMNEK